MIRRGRVLVAALTLAAALAALNTGHGLANAISAETTLTASPPSVNFGSAPLSDSGACNISAEGVPTPGCVTATITITNTGTVTPILEAASACEDLLSFDWGVSCQTTKRSWGGFIGNGPLSTCF